MPYKLWTQYIFNLHKKVTQKYIKCSDKIYDSKRPLSNPDIKGLFLGISILNKRYDQVNLTDIDRFPCSQTSVSPIQTEMLIISMIIF